jgi:hypothetical protein
LAAGKLDVAFHGSLAHRPLHQSLYRDHERSGVLDSAGAPPPELHEVLVDGEDGLELETLCRCDVFFLAGNPT